MSLVRPFGVVFGSDCTDKCAESDERVPGAKFVIKTKKNKEERNNYSYPCCRVPMHLLTVQHWTMEGVEGGARRRVQVDRRREAGGTNNFPIRRCVERSGSLVSAFLYF